MIQELLEYITDWGMYMKPGRFIVIVLDSFGVGAMDDVADVRPQDIGANTALKLIDYNYKKEWPTLLSMGLMNVIGQERQGFNKSESAIYGSVNLKHYGADTYFGHQEISGTDPKKPMFKSIEGYLDIIETDLISEGYSVLRLEKNNKEVLKVNNAIIVGDNMETDLGQAINVVGALDYCGWDMIEAVGKIVRRNVFIARVIAFGGSNVSIERLEENIISKKGFIGVDAPASGVYDKNYHVVHMGYGVDTSKQVLIKIKEAGYTNRLYGKVADIVYNPNDYYRPGVSTKEILDNAILDIKKYDQGFFFINVQETDLAGHAQDPKRYIDVLNLADRKIKEVIDLLAANDVLIVMADHGNDPFIGHSRHTRERVPLLIKVLGNKDLIDIGQRETMADVGATVANYFNAKPDFGTSFLNKLNLDNKSS